MKYMSFNNSCFFTALANLLEDFDIQVEDEDIINESLIRYVFQYNEETHQYQSGYQVQDEDIINHYLSRFRLAFVQNKYTCKDLRQCKLNMVDDLKSKKNCIVSLKVLQSKDRWHATIFKEYKDGTFKFLNMKHPNSDEPDFYEFKENDLIDMLADVVQFGWIESTDTKVNINLKELKRQSLGSLRRLKDEMLDSINLSKSKKQRLIERESLFRPILLSYRDVLSIIEESQAYEIVNEILRDYVKTFSLDDELVLSNYISENKLLDLFDRISKIIESKRILMIMHATSWCDKTNKAEKKIQRLIDRGSYDVIIEFIPDRHEIFNERYLTHNGIIIRHDEISPVPYLENHLSTLLESIEVSDNDVIHVVGGVYNDLGGCLNYLHRYMCNYVNKTGVELDIEILDDATY